MLVCAKDEIPMYGSKTPYLMRVTDRHNTESDQRQIDRRQMGMVVGPKESERTRAPAQR